MAAPPPSLKGLAGGQTLVDGQVSGRAFASKHVGAVCVLGGGGGLVLPKPQQGAHILLFFFFKELIILSDESTWLQ